jgi:acyl-homoserine lactone acylase PvdQ
MAPSGRGARALAALGAAALTAVVAAAPVRGEARPGEPIFGQFHSVLAQGEGDSVNATMLATYQLTGEPPPRFIDQQPLYAGVIPRAPTLGASDVGRFYKDTNFGAMPGGIGSISVPRDGVEILRDKRFGMAHVYGATRDAVMFGAGYATAQERLFLMDAIRRTAKGTLAGLTGPSAARGDAAQLTDQDFSDAELQAQFDELPRRFGPEGERLRSDILNYIEGINARIAEVNQNPDEMPAEYLALGTRPATWTVSDTAAMAVLLVTQFTVSNGGEERNAQIQQAFRERFGKDWRAPYHDLREAEDPEAFTVAKRPFLSDRPGPPRKGLNAMPDFDSIKPRNPMVSGPSEDEVARARGSLPKWVRDLNALKSRLPDEMSNAVLVSGRMTKSGRPVSAMGPQVSYFSPQIFVEYELHGGGIDVQGVTFPGASPWPLIGHGIDFVWSGTSANGDNQDTFVERLCNPDGSPPSEKSTHYLYKGECRAFTMREQKVTTPYSPLAPDTPPQEITHVTMRSVHGPVFAYATVGGAPVALTKAKGVNFHELDAALPFMRIAENQPTDAESFMEAFSIFPGTENWFYADDREIAFLQSGRYPRHARGSDVDRPFWGDGRADWQGFDPQTYTFETIDDSRRPQALEPRENLIISWNNKEAPGWRKGPTEWSNGPVHHALTLDRRVRAEARANGGKIDLAGITRAVNLAATTDVRGQEDYPWMRRVIGSAGGEEERMLGLLDAWHESGSNRLDADGDNAYDHSAAVALMDAWWPLLVRAQFEPALGERLFGLVERGFLSLGGPDDWGWEWATHVQKDLRNVLGRRVLGRYSRVYCGGPVKSPVPRSRLPRVRAACREVLLSSLRAAVAAVKAKKGADPARWRVPATCEQTDPPSCDQIVPSTAGAIDTPPFPWQNRGTYHQVADIAGHR